MGVRKACAGLVCFLVLLFMQLSPAIGQSNGGSDLRESRLRSDYAAVNRLLRLYETAFNARDVDLRMALCLRSYQETAFEQGRYVFTKGYEQTRVDVGRYWASLPSLTYTIDDYEVTMDPPLAFVRATTTHVAPGDTHTSVVYFNLVKVNRRWWIASDSYNIIARHDQPLLPGS